MFGFLKKQAAAASEKLPTIGPAIDPRWKAGRKAHLKNRRDWFDLFHPLTLSELEHYAASGVTLSESGQQTASDRRGWERHLHSELGMYSLLRQFEVEALAYGQGLFDYEGAASTFAAARLSEMIRLHLHAGSPERLGKQLATMDVHMLPATALGVAIGVPSALPLARLQVAASARGWYVHDDRYPVYVFILLLLAAFLQEAKPLATPALLGQSPLARLLDEWDNPQPESIVPLCLAACDFHTTRCKGNKDLEFSGGAWCYLPVALMLLMRLRSLRGLENAGFEHPLWSAAVAGIDPTVTPQRDGLIERVEQRMREDRYDESFIVERVLSM